MTPPPPSLADVAQQAGVSLATASRVLSPSGHPVAEGTRAKVLAAAEALDFVPNRLARGLAARRTNTIGVLVHDVTDEYFASIVGGIEDAARTRDVSVLICNSERDPDREVGYARTLRSMRVDAVLFAGSGISGRAHQQQIERELAGVEAAGGVVVRLAPHPRHPADVRYSNRTGFRLLVDYLVELGHRDVAFVEGPPRLAASRERLGSLRNALRRHDLGLPASHRYPGDFTREGGMAAATAFLEDGCPATVIACANDQLAIGVLRGLRAAGVDVPGDVSVTGFDDIPACAYVAPALTTVHVPLEELGRAGAEVAFARLDGQAPEPPRVEVHLVPRASTGPPS